MNKEKSYKVLLRNTSNKMVNIPSEIWKPLGWNLNDKLVIWIDECYNKDNETLTTPDYFEIRLVKEDDENKYFDFKYPKCIEGTKFQETKEK
jgi:hypothetical protein